MQKRKMLPSPAMLIACLALIAAVGGTAYAASKINGKDIKKDSITGKQIKESTVKNVASAKKAKTAKTADSARTAGMAKTADLAKDAVTATRAKDADTVGGQTPASLKTRYFVLDETGAIAEQSGGFTVLDAYDTNTNAYINAGTSLVGKAVTATVVIQNQIDTDPVTMGLQASRNGQVTASRCQITGVVDCAPPSAKIPSALVVSPSNADGSPAATVSPGTGPGTATKRVIVTVSE